MRFKASHGVRASAQGVTDANGVITATLTSTAAGRSEVVALINRRGEHVSVNFAPLHHR